MAQQLPLAALLFACGGWAFVFWGVCARVTAAVFGHWLIGHLAHNHGELVREIRGAAVQGRNVRFASLLTMGECWHNNHHAFPGSARLGLAPGEWDPGWWVLQALQRAGLVWAIRLPAGECMNTEEIRISLKPEWWWPLAGGRAARHRSARDLFRTARRGLRRDVRIVRAARADRRQRHDHLHRRAAHAPHVVLLLLDGRARQRVVRHRHLPHAHRGIDLRDPRGAAVRDRRRRGGIDRRSSVPLDPMDAPRSLLLRAGTAAARRKSSTTCRCRRTCGPSRARSPSRHSPRMSGINS